MFQASNIDNLLWANRLLTCQWQHDKDLGFLVLVLGPGLDSISRLVKLETQMHDRKRKEKSKFPCHSRKNSSY